MEVAGDQFYNLRSRAPLSLSKRRQETPTASDKVYNQSSKPAKKIREKGAAHGKIRKRSQRRNLSRGGKCPRKSPSDISRDYADQCNRSAVAALNHFNQLAASNMGVTYELVKASSSSGFLHRERGAIFHCNFLAKPINCCVDSETMLFFGEIWSIYPKDPVVTNCCILGSVDTVCLGNNGCEACCPELHHPAEGFYVGGRQSFLSH